MPVKIVALHSTDPREITLDEYEAGRDNFDTHYYYRVNDENTPFGGQDFSIEFASLDSAVTNFCSQNNIDASIVAIRLVHCFNTGNESLYMRLQICTMTATSDPKVFDLDTSPCEWYEIAQGSFATTGVTTLSDTPYLSNFYYEGGSPGTPEYEQLIEGTNVFVQNITYPWEAEIYQMYIDNGSPQSAYIHFASCSYTESPEAASVPFPHGNVLYLSVNNVPLLNNDNYISIFENKGADSGTLCPPNCNVYIEPNLV